MAEEQKSKNLTTPILVVLLVVASFLVGSLWTKVNYIEQEGKRVEEQEGEIAQGQPSEPKPEQPTVLGEIDIGRIEQGGAAARGEVSAPVTIVEFSEYQCPFCQRYVQDAYQQIWQEYGDQIYYIFRDYPLQFHQHAQKTAEAARCAGDQGQYWEMHDLLFEERDWTEKTDITSDMSNFARQLGLNQAEFANCLSSEKYTQAVKDDFALGENVGVSGTPTFFINGQMLVGAQPFAAFQVIIDEELEK